MKHITLYGPTAQGYTALVDDEYYDSLSKYRWNRIHVGKNLFYARTSINGMKVDMHVLILGNMPGFVIDHIDLNGLNNTRVNLRHVTKSANAHNSDTVRSTAGFRGVSYHKVKRKYQARIQVNYREHTIGYYDSPEEASKAYESYRRENRLRT